MCFVDFLHDCEGIHVAEFAFPVCTLMIVVCYSGCCFDIHYSTTVTISCRRKCTFYLSDLLIFVSGAAPIPPLVFQKKRNTDFIHHKDPNSGQPNIWRALCTRKACSP